MLPEKIHPYDVHVMMVDRSHNDVLTFVIPDHPQDGETNIIVNGKKYIQTVSVEPKTTWRP